ncbi:PE family protein [Mycobacterium botniense]|uniref:PE family protein n=1 Tax=Mycobacterium botniense TaxID=84962 RepID=A0A7I9Y0I6_9MYCO|nr:PE family protein [Mycobacterium botniense]GFG75549.1 PE family protein [Mycobacterium botniense]
MSFVTVLSEEIVAAADKLAGIGSAVTAQNAAAAASTTNVLPAAADQVSVRQAGLFSVYGQLYQHISAQATAIHQAFVNTLAASAGSYGTTEIANMATVNTSGSGISGLLGALFGGAGSSSSSSSLAGVLGNTGIAGLSGNPASMLNVGAGNWASAMSDVIGLAGGGLIDAPEEAIAQVSGPAGLDAALLTGSMTPAGSAGLGAAPVLARVGQGCVVGGLSVPPSWATDWATDVDPAGGTGASMTLANWTTTAPAPAATPAIPAGIPTAAAAGKAGSFGAPRYGVKPIVMPKPAVV